MLKVSISLILIVFCAIFANAQAVVDRDDNQSWNELQITVPMDKQFDFFLSGALRFGKDITRLNDSRIGVGFIFKTPIKGLSFSPTYVKITARNSAGRFRRENRLVFYAKYDFPFKPLGISISHRSQFEYRMRQQPSTWRYRPSLRFEKDLPKDFILKNAKLFLMEEPFYDSGLKKWSRNRFSAGINKVLWKEKLPEDAKRKPREISVEIYYMRQNDGFSIPGDLNVIGTTWKVKL